MLWLYILFFLTNCKYLTRPINRMQPNYQKAKLKNYMRISSMITKNVSCKQIKNLNNYRQGLMNDLLTYDNWN